MKVVGKIFLNSRTDGKTERRKDVKTERRSFFVRCRRTYVLNNNNTKMSTLSKIAFEDSLCLRILILDKNYLATFHKKIDINKFCNFIN